MSYKYYYCAIHDYIFGEGYKCMICVEQNLKQSTLEIDPLKRFPAKETAKSQPCVDHFKDIDATDRTNSAEYSIAMLCRQDKEQLNRIEAMLKQLLDRQI